MDKMIITPCKYIQGPDSIKSLGQYVLPMGNKALVLADSFVTELLGRQLTASFKQAEVSAELTLFNGECSRQEIDRLVHIAQEKKANVIVGVGGGKTLDTAKAVAFYTNNPVTIMPTLASTDAPTSALSVLYTPQGEFEEYLFYPKNPDMVVMDTQIVANAPTRLLVSGMGDALSTYFEARANTRSGKQTMAGGAQTLAAQALAKLCYETLLADGVKAKVACDNNLSSKALENIIEANTLLSGVGFESSGIAAAHAIHNGLTKLEECHHKYHGEKVAFGTLAQLILENAPMEEYTTVLQFCRSVGLPTNLFDLGVSKIDIDQLKLVAEAACAKEDTIHNMPFTVTPELVLSAILTAHQLGLPA